MKFTATQHFLRMSPRKVRLVAGVVKGLPAEEAAQQLAVHAKRASEPLLKTLRSAIANAKQQNDIQISALKVQDIRVSEGPVLKRFQPRAFGRATVIRKRMSHVTVVLESPEQTKAAKGTDAEKKKKNEKEQQAGKISEAKKS